MLELVFQGRVTASNENFDTAISDLEIVDGVLVSVSRMGGGLTSWALDSAGLPTLVRMRAAETHSVTGEGPVLAHYAHGNSTGVVVAGFAPGLLDVSTISSTSTISTPQDRDAGSGTWAHAQQINEGLLAVSEAGGNGFRLFSDSGSGALVQVQQVSDTNQSFADSISTMTSVQIGGRSFLFVGSSGEQGLTSYEISGHSTTLRDAHGPEGGLGLMVPTALEVVESGGNSFLIVTTAPGSGSSGSLSVMAISAGGKLTPTDHVLDTLHSRFGQVQSLSVAEYGDTAFVAAGGGDDGISLFILSDQGQLVHLDAFADTLAAGLSNITDIELHILGDTLHVYAASEDTRGISVLRVDLSDLGLVETATGGTLQGNNGDDILIDGSGAETLNGTSGSDTYVIGTDGNNGDRINNFNPADDILDLSGWAFLYDPLAIDIVATNKGARLTWRGEELMVHSHTGQSLNPDDLREAIHIDLNRTFQAPQVDLTGTNSADALAGTWGNDTLNGSGGNDTLTGGKGDDILIGGDGNNDRAVFAGDSDDVQSVFIDGDHVTLITGDGRDEIEGVEQFTFDNVTLGLIGLIGMLEPIQSAGTDGRDLIEITSTPVEIDAARGHDTLRTGAYNDTLIGGPGSDKLYAGGGDDQLVGDTGHDLLDAGSGDDTITPGHGNNTIHGGSGNDHVVLDVASIDADVITFANGSLTLVTDNGTYDIDGAEWFVFTNRTMSLAQMEDLLAPLEIEGSENSDALDVTGNVNARIMGYGGNDTVAAANGDDYISGGSGRDTINAGRGEDTITGGGGYDKILAGNGNDTVRGNAGDDTVKAGSGFDLVYGGNNNDVLRGQNYADTIHGGSGRDNIKGGAGHDQLFGNSHRDTLEGGLGNDLLRAGAGKDHLTGGAGKDKLKGGSGEDVFVFATGHDKDQIVDFDPAEDRLLLSITLTDGLTSGAQVRSEFATKTSDGILFDFGGGDTILLNGLSSFSGLGGAIDFF